MTRIILRALDETMEKILVNLMLITNAINKGNANRHGLFRTLIRNPTYRTAIENDITNLSN